MDETTPDALATIDVPSEETPPFVLDENNPNPNLVPQFEAHPDGVDALKEIADICVANFTMAWDGTEQYRKRIAKDWGLFAGELPPKKGQFANMANLHVPIFIENISRVCLRVVGEINQNEQEIMRFIPVGSSPEAKGVAETLTFHTNWQLRRSADWNRQLFRAVFAFFSIGDVTRHHYWDDSRMEIQHEVLQPDDFVTPYMHVSTMSDWSDVPFRVRILHLYRNQLQSKRAVWSNIDKVLEERPTFDDPPDTPVADNVAKKQGIEKQTEGSKKGPPTAPYKILQYEGWLELPGQDRDRWCKVILEEKKKTVLELTIHEHEQWQDVQRFNRQKAESDAYWMGRDAHEQMMAERQAQMAQHQEMLASPDPAMQMAAGQALQMQSQVPEPQAPLPPMWMKDPEDRAELPEPVKKVPIHLFTHAVCLEPLVGNLGLGYGRIQADLTRAANVALNQHVDAASFANLSCFFVSNQITIAPNTYIEPGKFIPLEASGQSIKDNIVPIQFGPANPQLLETVKFAYQWAQSSMQSPNILSGEPGKSGETKGGIMARIGQANQQVAVETRKFVDEDLKPTFKTHALLNSIYLSEEELFVIHDKIKGQAKDVKVTRAMYEESYDVEITADLKFATQAQKIDEADELLKAPLACPPLQSDLAFLWHAMAKSLEARNRYDMIALLGPDPMSLPVGHPLGPPQTPFGVPMPPPPGMAPPPGVVPNQHGAPGVPTPKVGTAPEHEATGGPPAAGPPSSPVAAGGPPVGSKMPPGPPGPGGPPA
jgi:hypothetical protein